MPLSRIDFKLTVLKGEEEQKIKMNTLSDLSSCQTFLDQPTNDFVNLTALFNRAFEIFPDVVVEAKLFIQKLNSQAGNNPLDLICTYNAADSFGNPPLRFSDLQKRLAKKQANGTIHIKVTKVRN